MIEYIFYIILGLIFVEIFSRVVVSIFIDKSFKSIFSIHIPLWKVFYKFGKIKKKGYSK